MNSGQYVSEWGLLKSNGALIGVNMVWVIVLVVLMFLFSPNLAKFFADAQGVTKTAETPAKTETFGSSVGFGSSRSDRERFSSPGSWVSGDPRAVARGVEGMGSGARTARLTDQQLAQSLVGGSVA
jgi:hypothetical protein